MAQESNFVTLGELLEEQGESEEDDRILDRIKLLAQETLPDGWTDWQAGRATKEEVFGEKVEPLVMNKLMFALPTVGLARAFDPEADHLSEKGYRDIRLKLLDWAFTRALILGPPAIANKVRGSAARTELFKQSTDSLRPLLHTRAEANRILTGELSESEASIRKKDSSISSCGNDKKSQKRRRSSSPGCGKKSRLDSLEERMNDMFSYLVSSIDSLKESRPDHPEDTDESSVNEDPYVQEAETHWEAPGLDADLDDMVNDLQPTCAFDLDFLPSVKEAEPPMPEPSLQIKSEGIDCQKLGTDLWNRVRYKEVEKSLHASPVFNALKVNMELGGLVQPSPGLAKLDFVLGTITHGLLLQRKALAEELKRVTKLCPSASEEVRKVLAKDSSFRSVSDNLLHYVCGHRAETIDFRRRYYKAKNDSLNSGLHQIPPSPTHLFEEKALTNYIKDHGGFAQVFPSRSGNFPDKKPYPVPSRREFRRPSAFPRPSNPGPSSFRGRSSGPGRATKSRPAAPRSRSYQQRAQSGRGADKRQKRRD